MAFHHPRIELPITFDQFHTLPRNPAYKYEYFDKRAVLSPRPKAFSCVLDLKPTPVPDGFDVRPLPAADIPGLEKLFLHANIHTQPYQSLDEKKQAEAAKDAIERVVAGDDGPLIEAACFQVFDDRRDGPIGAAVVTLVHPDILTVPFAGEWKEPPPADAVAKRLGVPHLTWIFVSWWEVRRGVGSALLAHAANALHRLGFPHLASTFALDNPASALWHWRNGFRLLPQMSAMGELIRRRKKASG